MYNKRIFYATRKFETDLLFIIYKEYDRQPEGLIVLTNYRRKLQNLSTVRILNYS